jgi:hypothetical protein
LVEAGGALEPAHQDGIRRALRQFRPEGGRLVFALGRSAIVRAQVCTALGGTVVELHEDEADPWALLDGVGDRIVVVGLSVAATPALFARLNLGRERVQRRALRLVVWLKQVGQMELIREAAPDLWAHRAGFLPFLTEEDLPIDEADPGPSLLVRITEQEGRIGSWRGDPGGKLWAKLDLVHLLSEAGQYERARNVLDGLERRWRRLRLPAGARDAIEVARRQTKIPVARLETALPTRLRTKGQVAEWADGLAQLVALGKLQRVSEALENASGIAGSPGVSLDVNRGVLLSVLGSALDSPVQIELGLGELKRSFPLMNPASRHLYASRMAATSARTQSEAQRLRGDWLPALESLAQAGNAAAQTGAGPTALLLIDGAKLAWMAGLPGLGALWLKRAIVQGQTTGMGLQAAVLRDALRLAPGPIDPEWVSTARALIPQLLEAGQQCDLWAAVGLADDPSLARRELQHRRARHGYDGFVAARALCRMELALGEGRQAAANARSAMTYADKHGGYALRAQLWADAATGYRMAREWGAAADAVTEAQRILTTAPVDLHPASLLVQLSREQAALCTQRGALDEAAAVFAPARSILQARGVRLLEIELLVAATRFGGGSRASFGQQALELAIEIGLPALEADVLLELAALSTEQGAVDTYALERATWWIERIGDRAARRRLAEVQASLLPSSPLKL